MNSRALTSILAGVAGASALTAIHEVARRRLADAPRMDVVGMRALTRGRRAAGIDAPPAHAYAQTLAGDLLSNSAYYALVAAGDPRTVWARGAALGALAGVGALLVPPRVGLGDPPRSERWSNRVMTVAWYLAGGLVAAAVSTALARVGSDGESESADIANVGRGEDPMAVLWQT